MKYVLLLFFLVPFRASAQVEATPVEEPVESGWQEETEGPAEPALPVHRPPARLRPVSTAQWTEASSGLDYSKDRPKPPKVEKPDRAYRPNFDWTSATQGLGNVLQVVAIVLAAAMIGYAIYRMLKVPRNRVIARDGVEITVDNIEQYIHETDLDRFLQEALGQGNFPLAIRLYYLQIIKDLSAKNVIRWAREKTNREYLRELRQHRLAESFQAVTWRYEEIWYGNRPLDAAGYAQLEPAFKQFLTAI